MSQVSLRYENNVADLDLVEPMWNALQEHHSRITPELDPQTPKRNLADAWRLRRSKYVRWLEDPETFLIIVEERMTRSGTWRSPRPGSKPTSTPTASASATDSARASSSTHGKPPQS